MPVNARPVCVRYSTLALVVMVMTTGILIGPDAVFVPVMVRVVVYVPASKPAGLAVTVKLAGLAGVAEPPAGVKLSQLAAGPAATVNPRVPSPRLVIVKVWGRAAEVVAYVNDNCDGITESTGPTPGPTLKLTVIVCLAVVTVACVTVTTTVPV